MSNLKEPHFFRQRPLPRKSLIRKVCRAEEYLQTFDNHRAPYRCDASTSYLHDSDALPAIQAVSPDARFVICLRDPVERAWSHYLADHGYGIDTRSFRQALEDELSLRDPFDYDYWTYIEHSCYSRALEQYLTLAPGRVLVLLLEEGDDAQRLKVVADFLGLSPLRVGSADIPRNEYRPGRNALFRGVIGSRTVRGVARAAVPTTIRNAALQYLRGPAIRPELDSRDRKLLLSSLGPDIDRTEEVLGRRLPWGRRTQQA